MWWFHIGKVSSKECPGTKENPFFSNVRPLRLVDPEHRLIVMSIPKAGATIAAQLLVDYVGLRETARAYHPWIHTYRRQQCIFQFRTVRGDLSAQVKMFLTRIPPDVRMFEI